MTLFIRLIGQNVLSFCAYLGQLAYVAAGLVESNLLSTAYPRLYLYLPIAIDLMGGLIKSGCRV